ncbi:mucin-5AC isoform X2 [Protobothrops mucrosquamatus]|uniref:mucin-5AC isoform X2 n=1 Tax=Protobothrops mucrosquamatus TaxID=103944 RepID=UPI0007758ED5|nr:mucin-5AC isoform X2 [Protobothrops mucrosquamatus]
MTSEAEITSWWPGSSLSSTYSSITQDRSTPKASSTGLLSSNPGRSSLGLSTPSSTTPSSEGPATTMTVVPSITTAPSAFPSLPQTAEATTQVTTSPPTSMSTSEPYHFTSVSDTTGGMKTTPPALKSTEFLPSSVALLSDTTNPWRTVGKTSLPGGATTLLSSSSPEGSTPAGTSDITASSSSLAMTSTSSTAFGGPSEEGTTQPTESTMLIISSTTEDTISIPHSPTPQDKMTSEDVSTTISTTSQEETTSEKHASSPPTTTETMTISPSSVPLPTSSLATSTLLSATSGVGDTTGSLEVTMTSEAEVTSWWPGSSLSSTYSSVTQERSTPKASSTGLLSSRPGRSSLGLSTPSSTTPSSEGPATTITVVPSITTSPSAFTSLPQTSGETTTKLTTFPPTRVPTSLPHLFTPMSDTTGGMETTTPSLKTTEFLPSSEALLSSPWSTLGERSLPGEATMLLSSSSPEGSTSAGTPDVTVSSSSLAMTSIPSTSFGGPSKEGTSLPSESTMLVIRSTTQEMNSSSRPPTPQDNMTSEGPLTTISTTSTVETPSEKHARSLPLTTETITTSPLLPLLTSTLVTSTPTSGISGVGDTTGSSEVTMTSEAEVTSWWPGSSLSSTYSSVTQDRSTPKATSVGLLSSNPGRSSLGLSGPSSTNPTSQSLPMTLKVLSSISPSPSASEGLSKTPARNRFILSVRFSTPLNIADLSVRRAMLKWLDHELQAKFPVGNFHLTCMG